MKLAIIKCPRCGHMNRNLDLEDSKGWNTTRCVECERCGTIAVIPLQKPTRVRIYRTNTIKYMKPVKC